MGFFSPKTKKYYRLVETKTWPTLEISGIRMHQTKLMDPKRDTYLKVKCLGRVKGKILDSCTGLGYTTITLAKIKGVERVFSIEKDENVLKICKQNPYSKELFSNPKIILILGDVFELAKVFPSNFFDSILHDPPTFSLAGNLYSKDLYFHFHRILKKGGKIFHYVGRPGIRRGRNILKGVVKRMREVGFKILKKDRVVRGVVGLKV